MKWALLLLVCVAGCSIDPGPIYVEIHCVAVELGSGVVVECPDAPAGIPPFSGSSGAPGVDASTSDAAFDVSFPETSWTFDVPYLDVAVPVDVISEPCVPSWWGPCDAGPG